MTILLMERREEGKEMMIEESRKLRGSFHLK